MGRAVKGALLGVALLLALVGAPFSAHAQEAITIEGLLKNGTAGAEAPQGLMVNLNVFKLGESLETKGAVADAEGRFSFEGVPGGQGVGYIISTEYAGGRYLFESDYPLPPEPVELVIYESTSSSEAIKVRSHTLVINAADSSTRLMNALELVGLENTGDRTFVPDIAQAGPMQMLRFSLPSTARNLDVQSNLRGGQIVQVDLGFAITAPVPPGTSEIAYTYLSSYAGGKLTFSHSLPFGADTFRVLILQNLGQASGTGLQEMEHLVLGERNYQRLEAHDLNAGTKITLDFTGLPEPSLWRRWQDAVSGEDFLRGAIPGAFGMALLALLAYVLFRKREPSRATAGVPGGPGKYPVLTEAMARLDDRFQQRELGKQEYLQQRRELKGQILGSGDDILRVDERLLQRLEYIGQIKEELPLRQRGWCSELGLFVQLRESMGMARLQAGGKYRAQVDAWRDSPGKPWRVKKYNTGNWEALVEPTARIAEWLLAQGGLTKEHGKVFMRAVEAFQREGRLDLP